MVRGPGVPAAEVRQQLVLNNDFAPTIADLADASIPRLVDGSSFAQLLTNSPPSSWRTAFLEESWREGGTTVPAPTHKGVHTQDHMFIEYDTGEYELYDLVLDPYQLQSISRAGNEQLYSDLQTSLNALKACSGSGTTTASCRAAEGFPGTTTPPPPPTDTSGPPKVTSTSPTANATGVARTENLTATFSEDMMASSITGQSFKLFKKGSTTKLSATVSYQASTDMATLDPTNSLQAGVTYKAVVTTGAKDVAGIPLDQNSTTSGNQQKGWTFTTGTR